jgi:DamX protein
VAKPAAAPVSNSASGWYATQPAGNYLVQVLGTGSQSKAQALVNQYGGNYRYFTKQHQGKPLYVLTYGSFANRNAAVAAIKALPAELQAGKPWVRTFASVQQENTQAR